MGVHGEGQHWRADAHVQGGLSAELQISDFMTWTHHSQSLMWEFHAASCMQAAEVPDVTRQLLEKIHSGQVWMSLTCSCTLTAACRRGLGPNEEDKIIGGNAV